MDRIEDFEVNSPRWLSLEDFEGEVWKDIPGYKGWYQVSNMGRIKSLDRFYTQKRKCEKKTRQTFIKGKIIKASSYGQYLICHLKRNGTSKAVKFHRVVCTMFHPNRNKLPEVNHINEIKTDNRADNLEWCTRIHNARWGTAIERCSRAMKNHPSISHVVYQFTFDGEFIAKYPSAKEAERVVGIPSNNIRAACNNGRSSSAKGYLWSYTQDPTTIKKKVERKRHGLTFYSEKRVKQFTTDGKYITTFNSISQAADATGAKKSNIAKCCQHLRKYHSSGGYKWEWDDTPKSEWIVNDNPLLRIQRPIVCRTLDGKFVAEYKNQAEAARSLKLFTGGISRCCRGEYSQCGGYVFSFK